MALKIQMLWPLQTLIDVKYIRSIMPPKKSKRKRDSKAVLPPFIPETDRRADQCPEIGLQLWSPPISS